MKNLFDKEFIEQEIRQELYNSRVNRDEAANDVYFANADMAGNQNSISRVDARPLSAREAERFENAIISGVIEGLSIEDLAQRCCYSLSTFKRRFNEHYNIPPHRWILQCRLNIACRLLTKTDEPVSSVASICGFVNNSHFIATFRRHHGLTPRKYRSSSQAE